MNFKFGATVYTSKETGFCALVPEAAGKEAAVVAGMEAAVVAGMEAAVVAGMEAAGIINFSLPVYRLMHMITYTSNSPPTPMFSFSACHVTSPTCIRQWQGSSRPTRTLQLPSV